MQVIDLRTKIMNVLHSQATNRTSLRNQIMDALNRFIERRTDGYPNLGRIASLVTEVGASAPGAFIP